MYSARNTTSTCQVIETPPKTQNIQLMYPATQTTPSCQVMEIAPKTKNIHSCLKQEEEKTCFLLTQNFDYLFYANPKTAFLFIAQYVQQALVDREYSTQGNIPTDPISSVQSLSTEDDNQISISGNESTCTIAVDESSVI